MALSLVRVPLLLGCLAALLAAMHGTVSAANPYGRVAGNPADRLSHLPIEDYRYDRATRCRLRATGGALAMTAWLERNVRGVSWGIMRCEKLSHDSYSLHAAGRAIDWHLSVHRPADRRAARRLIRTLLATDRAGNPHALARRMGVQEIIWNCRSWWSGAERMGRYSLCFDRRGRRRKGVSDTLAHRDHVHIGLNLQGARAGTSFWHGKGRR